MKIFQGTRADGLNAINAIIADRHTMTDPHHGNSIITRLRLIIEEMANLSLSRVEVLGLRAKAENLLPIANVDDIEIIVLREAAAILNGRDWYDFSDNLEAAANRLERMTADERAIGR